MRGEDILLFGKDGQLGWALRRSLAPLGKLVAVGREECDLADPPQIRSMMRSVRPAVVVNAAAYTAVDKAEKDAPAAERINATAPGVIAEEAKDLGSLLIHVSTDYVFDGTKNGAYEEADEPNPINVYGRTKLDGERAISASGCRHLIFRTSGVYGLVGANFPRKIFELAAARDELRVVADQVGAPTSVDLIADVLAHCLARRTTAGEARAVAEDGIYHLQPTGEVSWHGVACELVRLAAAFGLPLRVRPERILPISTAEYPLPARRQANSRLATGKLAATFDVRLPPWQLHIERFVREFASTCAWTK
jgi:dTDP-4-dehydrorhamnose reductase